MSNCPVTVFDHHSAEYAANRDTMLAELRATAPVAWTEAHGGHWVVSTYELVRKVITDDRTFTVEHLPDGRGGLTIPDTPRPRIIPGETDGEEHTRYRAAAGERFTRPAVKQTVPWIKDMVDELVRELAEKQEFDAVTELALPVPIAVVLEYLKLDVDDPVKYFRAAELAIGIRIEEDVDRDEEEIQAEIAAVWDRLFAAVQEKRNKPDDGVISKLIQREPPLTDLEIRDIVVSVVLGGARTTAALIENMLWHLHEDRELRATLSSDRSLIPKAVDEFVRFYSPSQVVARTAAEDVELGGVRIAKGDRVLVSWHSANHDETVFPDPEEFRLDRKGKQHLGFGAGPHFCLGTWLAKAEVEIVLNAVLDHMPDYALDEGRCRRYEDMLINQWVTMPMMPSAARQ